MIFFENQSLPWRNLAITVKLGLTTMSKRRPSAQDDRFRSVPIFLLKHTRIKQYVKDNHLSSVPTTTPNLDQIKKNVTEDDRVIFTRLFLPRRKIFSSATSEIFSTKNLFKKTTCLRWPIYISTQGGRIRHFYCIVD